MMPWEQLAAVVIWLCIVVADVVVVVVDNAVVAESIDYEPYLSKLQMPPFHQLQCGK